MSWSASFKKPVTKSELKHAIEQLDTDGAVDPCAYDQFQAAKDAAYLIAKSVPGPLVMVALNGHANGVGWNKKDGMANDCINISVSQVANEDLRYYTNA